MADCGRTCRTVVESALRFERRDEAMKKKLIEVALPLEAINKASAQEKPIRHGHPSTFHLWWARRPLAAARAVIFAQMVDARRRNSQCRSPTRNASGKAMELLYIGLAPGCRTRSSVGCESW